MTCYCIVAHRLLTFASVPKTCESTTLRWRVTSGVRCLLRTLLSCLKRFFRMRPICRYGVSGDLHHGTDTSLQAMFISKIFYPGRFSLVSIFRGLQLFTGSTQSVSLAHLSPSKLQNDIRLAIQHQVCDLLCHFVSLRTYQSSRLIERLKCMLLRKGSMKSKT